MARTRSLSDFWRIDRSDDRVMELVSVLQGGDSLIGLMGSNVRACWSTNGESETWWVRTKEGKPVEMRVFLDYSPLSPLRPPFDGRAVDEVIGYAAHEGGHCLWSSSTARDFVIQILERSGKPTWSKAAKGKAKVEEVLRVLNVLEDAYIDYHVGDQWAVLGEYIRYARQQLRQRNPIDMEAIAKNSRPARNSVMNLWIAVTLYEEDLPPRLSARVRRAMDFLVKASVEAVQTGNTFDRIRLAVDCWALLVKEFPKQDEPLPPKPQPQDKPQDTGQAGQAGAEGGAGEGVGGAGEAEGEKAKPGEAGEAEKEEQPGELGEGAGEPEDGEPEEDEIGEPEEDGGAEEDEEEDGDGDGGGGGGKPDQEFGHFGGEEEEEEGEQPSSPQGGDEAGSPKNLENLENLDSFDIRDIEEIPEEVLQEVLDAVIHEMEDLSRSVAEVISRPYGDVNAQTKRADYDAPAAAAVRAQVEPQIAEMRRVFDREASIQTRHLHGMTSGKLSTRRLARVGAGNLRVFKRKEVLERPDLAIGLLLDVSGSMNQLMDVVWATASVFAESLTMKPGVNFLCLTYTGGYFKVQTTRIADRGMGKLHLGNVEQGGGTPSGPALGSMKVLMDRMPERQKVIIHFTDGGPDDGSSSPSVDAALTAARKAGYRVWAIAPQGCERYVFQYGDGNWQTIGSIGDLPAKVLELVKTLTSRK